MYYILGFIAFLFLSLGIFLMLSKNRKLAIGVICVTLGIVSFVSIPIIVLHSFFFSKSKHEVEQSVPVIDMNWNATVSNSVQGTVDEQLLRQILMTFSRRCIPVIQQNPNCVEFANAEIQQYKPNDKFPLYRQEEYNWFTEIQINVKIKDDSRVMVGNRLLSGQTLWYFIGGGTSPGIDCLKSESAVFIGVDEKQIIDGQNTFVPIADYKLIDQLVK